MRVVIADTSPINYLILVGAIEILTQMYGRVTIPDVVLRELTDEDAPKMVSTWATTRPEWIDVLPSPPTKDPSLGELDAGEQAAILLAQTLPEVLLLIDDASGRVEATKRGVATIGTLGVLRAASLQGFVALRPALALLMS